MTTIFFLAVVGLVNDNDFILGLFMYIFQPITHYKQSQVDNDTHNVVNRRCPELFLDLDRHHRGKDLGAGSYNLQESLCPS